VGLANGHLRIVPGQLTRTALLANPRVALVETRHGVHCGYLSRDPGDEMHCAESTVT
jgi:predicted alpha/beta-fold hydrolase